MCKYLAVGLVAASLCQVSGESCAMTAPSAKVLLIIAANGILVTINSI